MNLDLETAAEWLSQVADKIDNAKSDVLIFPSYVLLTDLMDMYEGDKLLFGAQNCSHHGHGAYTGEVSANQLASIGVDFVLAGHSERRQYFNEDDAMIGKKVSLIILHEMTPVFCCGEPLEVRNQGNQQSFVRKQIEEALFHLSPAQMSEVVIAYEPVWAIGTGLNATPEQAQEMHSYIRSVIAEKYQKHIADATPILYGGSCKPDNAKSLFACADVDGGLIGGASLKPEDFLKIIEAAG